MRGAAPMGLGGSLAPFVHKLCRPPCHTFASRQAHTSCRVVRVVAAAKKKKKKKKVTQPTDVEREAEPGSPRPQRVEGGLLGLREQLAELEKRKEASRPVQLPRTAYRRPSKEQRDANRTLVADSYVGKHYDKTTKLLVDGYNVCFDKLNWPELQVHMAAGELELARDKLVDYIRDLASMCGYTATIVFDSNKAAEEQSEDREGVQVVYTTSAMNADGWIEAYVAEQRAMGFPELITVATSDRAEMETVIGDGCSVMSSRLLRLQYNNSYCTLVQPWIEDESQLTEVNEDGNRVIRRTTVDSEELRELRDKLVVQEFEEATAVASEEASKRATDKSLPRSVSLDSQLAWDALSREERKRLRTGQAVGRPLQDGRRSEKPEVLAMDDLSALRNSLPEVEIDGKGDADVENTEAWRDELKSSPYQNVLAVATEGGEKVIRPTRGGGRGRRSSGTRQRRDNTDERAGRRTTGTRSSQNPGARGTSGEKPTPTLGKPTVRLGKPQRPSGSESRSGASGVAARPRSRAGPHVPPRPAQGDAPEAVRDSPPSSRSDDEPRGRSV